MRHNVTATPVIDGIPRKDMRETRQWYDDGDQAMAISLATTTAMYNARKQGVSFGGGKNTIVLSFETVQS